MRASCTGWAVLAAVVWLTTASPTAYGGKVYLVGGGSYEGKVRVEGDRVIVEIPGGSITLDRDQVLRIEPGDDAYASLLEQRGKLAANDAAGHYRLGLRAASSDLPVLARDLFAAALRIQPDYGPAQLALGKAFLDGAWVDSQAVADCLQQWVARGHDASAFAAGRQALAGLLPPNDRRAILEATATAGRRLGYFAQASSDYRELAGLGSPLDAQSQRRLAVAELLKEHPSGLYLVQADAMVQVAGQGGDDLPSRSGFGSLADDGVLQAALRDRAKQLVGQGQELMATGLGAAVTSSSKAAGLYQQADDMFGRAETLSPGIARSYRVEVRRRLIQIRQSASEGLALRFDALNRTLPVAVKVKQNYRNQLKLMLGLLDEIQKELEQVLILASAYPQDLNLAITWTHEDLATVKAMRRTLESELEQTGGGRSP